MLEVIGEIPQTDNSSNTHTENTLAFDIINL